MARVILHAGKGEVGKATIAAATNLLPPELCYRTPTPSADNTCNLADSFGIPRDNIFEPISPHLQKQKTAISKTLDDYRGTIQKMLNKDEEV